MTDGRSKARKAMKDRHIMLLISEVNLVDIKSSRREFEVVQCVL